MVGGSLLLPVVVAADAGDYACTANNTVGSASVTTRVAVATPLTVRVRGSCSAGSSVPTNDGL